MIKVAAYLRVSTDEQAEQNISIPMQQSRLAAFCQSKDWMIEDFYLDDGCSGKNLDRPAIKRLIIDAKEKKFNMVLVLKLDRLSRRQQHVMYLIEDVFDPNNIGFTSVLENFDTNSSMGKAMLGIMAVFAQLERETIVQRVTDAKKEAAKQGRYGGGVTPYGYVYNREIKNIEIAPIQAEVVKFIFDEYIKGEVGYQSIVEILSARKIPPPAAAEWNRVSIRKIISSPFYAGMIPHKGATYPGHHKAIVSFDVWEKAQQVVRSRGGARPIVINPALLQGIVFCGECGARMRYKMVQQKYPKENPTVSRYYACYSQEGSPQYMVKDLTCRCGYKSVEKFDKMVVDELVRMSIDENYFKNATSDLLKTPNTSKDKTALTSIRKEYDGIKKRMDKWANAFEEDVIDINEYQEHTKQLNEKRVYLDGELTRLSEKINSEQQRSINLADVLSALRNFDHLWKQATEPEQKNLLHSFVKRTTIYKDNHIAIDFEE